MLKEVAGGSTSKMFDVKKGRLEGWCLDAKTILVYIVGAACGGRPARKRERPAHQLKYCCAEYACNLARRQRGVSRVLMWWKGIIASSRWSARCDT